jgi:hypothetical protein
MRLAILPQNGGNLTVTLDISTCKLLGASIIKSQIVGGSRYEKRQPH